MIIKRTLHAVLVILAAIPWTIAVSMGAICLFLVVQADNLWPNATWGNCWSYMGPKWFKQGGYIGVRKAIGVRIFKIGWIPHAIWIKSLSPKSNIEHTTPITRSNSKWLPWRIIYFPFDVKYIDPDQDAEL